MFLHGVFRMLAGEGIAICAFVLAVTAPAVGVPMLPVWLLAGLWGIVSGTELALWSEIAKFEQDRRL